MDQPNTINRGENPLINNNNANIDPSGLDSNGNKAEVLPHISNQERLSSANMAVAQVPSITQPRIPIGSAIPQQSTQSSSNPIMADDVDVIEKEWVQKAKKIVSETQNDPYRRSAEFAYTKHDYVKTRFGKDTKLPDKLAA